MRKNIFGFLVLIIIVLIGVINLSLIFVFSAHNNDLNEPSYQDDTIYYGTPIWNECSDIHVFSALRIIVINDISYVLDGDVWRDFMPYQPDTRLRVSVSVIANTSFPSTIEYDVLWVKKGSETYSATFYSGNRQTNCVNKMTYGGPKWEEGSIVDIVVRMIDENKGTYYLKSENHTLTYTW